MHAQRAGTVTRSLLPFASRTTISRRSNSTSFTRNLSPSSRRIPVPYSKATIRPIVPDVASSSRRASVGVNTTGKRCVDFAAITSSSHGNSIFNTSRYKNSKADFA